MSILLLHRKCPSCSAARAETGLLGAGAQSPQRPCCLQMLQLLVTTSRHGRKDPASLFHPPCNGPQGCNSQPYRKLSDQGGRTSHLQAEAPQIRHGCSSGGKLTNRHCGRARTSQDLHARGNDQHCSRMYTGAKLRGIWWQSPGLWDFFCLSVLSQLLRHGVH